MFARQFSTLGPTKDFNQDHHKRSRRNSNSSFPMFLFEEHDSVSNISSLATLTELTEIIIKGTLSGRFQVKCQLMILTDVSLRKSISVDGRVSSKPKKSRRLTPNIDFTTPCVLLSRLAIFGLMQTISRLDHFISGVGLFLLNIELLQIS